MRLGFHAEFFSFYNVAFFYVEIYFFFFVTI